MDSHINSFNVFKLCPAGVSLTVTSLQPGWERVYTGTDWEELELGLFSLRPDLQLTPNFVQFILC